ncbi:MAG: hypothetical protein MPJ51_11585 [Ruegeria sp.]|nr:hypothetical protein [Ruegeria sp.]
MFLASEGARYINGQSILSDGGMNRSKARKDHVRNPCPHRHPRFDISARLVSGLEWGVRPVAIFSDEKWTWRYPPYAQGAISTCCLSFTWNGLPFFAVLIVSLRLLRKSGIQIFSWSCNQGSSRKS